MSMSESSSTGSVTTTSSSASTGSSVDTSGGGSSSPSVSSESRPATFQEAFQAVGATDTPESGVESAAQTTPAPAIAEPATDGTATPAVEEGQAARGPIPLDRHEAILRNARTKTVQEVVSQVESKYGGAIQLQQRMTSDPIGTLTQLIDEAVAHPEIGQHVVSQLARTLSARRKAGSDLQPIDTEVGPVYTADQVQQLVEQSIAQRLQPFEQEREAHRQQAEAHRVREETLQNVKSRVSEWERQPGFSDHKSEIAAAQAAFVRRGVDTWTALGLAYAAVVPSKLQAKTTTQFVQDAVRKANASTSNPATVAPTMKPRPRDFREAFAQLRGAS